MTVSEIDAFLAVVRYGSMAEAARRLYTSQPTLSRRLHSLEEELGYALLLRNKGVVLSRAQLESHVWDYDFEGGSNIVDVYVRYLRRKIDDPFEKKLIQTVRGVGYTIRQTP